MAEEGSIFGTVRVKAKNLAGKKTLLVFGVARGNHLAIGQENRAVYGGFVAEIGTKGRVRRTIWIHHDHSVTGKAIVTGHPTGKEDFIIWKNLNGATPAIKTSAHLKGRIKRA